MKKMTLRIFCLALSLILCVGCFAGCGAAKKSADEEIIEEQELDLGEEDLGDDEETTTTVTGKGDSTTEKDNGSNGSTTGGSAITSHGSAGKVDIDADLLKKLKGTTVKILWWHDFTDADKKVIKKFEEETGIKIQYKFAANDGDPYTDLLATAMSGKEGYDIAMFNYASFPFRPLSTMQPLEKISNYDASDWDQDIVNAYKINGHSYGVNINGSNNSEYVVMYYNKQLFSKAGCATPREYMNKGNWNWDTFLDCAKATTTKNSDGTTTYGYVNLWSEAVSYWTLAGGTDFVSYNSSTSKFTSNIGNAALENSLSFFLKIANRGYMDSSMPYGIDAFLGGKAAMFSCITYQMFNDSDTSAKFIALNGGKNGNNLDAVPFPLPKGKEQVALMDASAFGVLQGAKNPEGALEFLKYFLNPANYDKAGKFINDNLMSTYEQVSKMKKVIAYTRGVMTGAALADYAPIAQLICKSDVAQVKSTLEQYKNQFSLSVDKANKKIKNTK